MYYPFQCHIKDPKPVSTNGYVHDQNELGVTCLSARISAHLDNEPMLQALFRRGYQAVMSMPRSYRAFTPDRRSPGSPCGSSRSS